MNGGTMAIGEEAQRNLAQRAAAHQRAKPPQHRRQPEVRTAPRPKTQRIDSLLGLRQAYRSRVQQARASALLLRIIDELFSLPAITNPAACERLKVTPRSAQLNIDKLVAHGILREATGRHRNRVYVAAEIVQIVDREEP